MLAELILIWNGANYNVNGHDYILPDQHPVQVMFEADGPIEPGTNHGTFTLTPEGRAPWVGDGVIVDYGTGTTTATAGPLVAFLRNQQTGDLGEFHLMAGPNLNGATFRLHVRDVGDLRGPCGDVIYSCEGDLDRDGQVGFTDLTLVLNNWGTPDGDVGGNGHTGFGDLTRVLNNWGECG